LGFGNPKKWKKAAAEKILQGICEKNIFPRTFTLDFFLGPKGRSVGVLHFLHFLAIFAKNEKSEIFFRFHFFPRAEIFSIDLYGVD